MHSFASRCGQWVVVAGALEGVGAVFARRLADRGINVVLLARRQAVLDDEAAAIRTATGVERWAVAVDLTEPGAMTTILEATDGLDVGMLVYNAGAGLAGAANIVAYGATKAFDIVLAEGLWAELNGAGVDVLSLVLGATDTPAFRRMLVKRGVLATVDDPIAVPGVATVDDVVAEAVENLANGPTRFAGDQLHEGARQLGALLRSDAVKLLHQRTSIMDPS